MTEEIERIYNRLVADEQLKSGTKYERLAALVFQVLDRSSFGNGGLIWPHCGGLKWPHLRPTGC